METINTSTNQPNPTSMSEAQARVEDGDPSQHHQQQEQQQQELEEATINQDHNHLKIIGQLKLSLADKTSECEMLNIQLNESNREIDVLSRELNECKLTLFERAEDSNKTHEEVGKFKKLEEDYVKLMSEFLKLGEKNERNKQELYDVYISKSNAVNNLECLISSGALKKELSGCKLELDNRLGELNLARAEIRNLEEETAIKDKNINELRKSIADAKVTHKHEITVLEEYIQCLKNTITSYEKTLAGYIEQPPRATTTSISIATREADSVQSVEI